MSQNSLSLQERIHYTNKWCRSIGIKNRDLHSHKTIDDAILLIRFHQANWSFMDKKERGVWAALWSYVYHKECGLKEKHLIKLENICNSVIFRQQKQAERLATIKALRSRLSANAQG